MSSKYRDLVETPGHVIVGVQHTETFSLFHHSKGKLTTIQGFPACPECGKRLTMKWKLAKWVCTGCGTLYTADELVGAIEAGDAAETVRIRGMT